MDLLENLNLVIAYRDNNFDSFIHMDFDYRLLIHVQKIILRQYLAYLPRQLAARVRERIKGGDVHLLLTFLQLKAMAINLREFLSDIFCYFGEEEIFVQAPLTKPDKDYLKRFEAKKNIIEEEFQKIMSILPNLEFRERRWVENLLIKNEDEKFNAMLSRIQV